ncbi:YegS/Rv2252/BmrU family lipid kinase [Parvibaculum indicum]|uniref:diacylglycerol/lipid kinase family protein n=1 Tax=Parvibaculum indicum TaxID=562969 RepID=UPI001422BCEE|nr:diacylglycerol kinase family protein [Parvibaculum indicum]NIJ42367.1 YegS/Rv2252/BmrU family lipid kinase [Parvibaculum indicum]
MSMGGAEYPMDGIRADGYMPHVAAVVNPRSGGGYTGRAWRRIASDLEKHLGPVRAHFTASPSSPHYLPAAELTRQALREGAQLVIAVGGDGTINEVVNGFYEGDEQINPEAHLAILNCGTGGDFRRTFGFPQEWEKGIAHIASGDTRRIDIGRLRFIAEDGRETRRYFNNIASFGMSGDVVRAVNRATWQKNFGGSFTFFWCSMMAMLGYRPRPVRIRTDAGLDEVMSVGTCAVANGRFFGGGMMIAPDAAPDDGIFDVTVLRDMGFFDFAKNSGSLYKGEHIGHPKVTTMRARWLEAEPVGDSPVLLDVDGEAPGRLPARFEILPGALTLRV